MPANSNILNADTFGTLFSENRDRFIRIAFSYVRDMDTAKDIVTDSFLYLWERRHELTTETNIKGYIYYCVRNRCTSFLRSKLAHSKIHGELSRATLQNIQSSLISLGNGEIYSRLFQEEVIAIFQKELNRMPALTRDIFLASRNDGLTYQQIADKFNIPVRRVTAEIQSALQHLRHSLKDYLLILSFIIHTIKN